MKTRKLALAAGAFAGLAALPLTTASAATAPPSGAANAAALRVTLSTAPITNVVNQVSGLTGGAFSWQTLTGELSTLAGIVCGAETTALASCPINLDILSDMPSTLQVAVGQSNEFATLNATGTDVTAGHADSTPLATNWASLNANLGGLEAAIGDFQQQVLQALSSDQVQTAETLLSGGLSAAGISGPVLQINHSNIFGTVAANLAQPKIADYPYQTANAVDIQGANQLQGLQVLVDPFTACAANAALAAKCSATGDAQTSANNTLTNVGLPLLDLSKANAAGLTSLASELSTILNLLTQAIADPSNAGSILSGAPLPAPISSALGELGSLIGGTAGGANSTASSAIGIDLLKTWDTNLAATTDSLNALIKTLAALSGMPDTTKLVQSINDISTAKTVPTSGGGVLSTASSSLGSLSILPVGDTLASTLNTALGNLPSIDGVPVRQLGPDTALLKIEGITSSAQAAVGSAPACSPAGVTPVEYVCASSGLKTVSVLGQTIDLDNGTINDVNPSNALPQLGAGQEVHLIIDVPTLGSLTLDITRGLPQIVSDTAQAREANISALDVRLINGAVPCTDPSKCQDLTPKAAPSGDTQGISTLGKTGDTVADASASYANVNASLVPESQGGTPCTVDCSSTKQVALPSTGMFGGGALPAGLVLIAVAISLRVLPTARFLPRRVR